MLAIAIVIGLVAYSLVVGNEMPRTKLERDIAYYADLAEKKPTDASIKLSLGGIYLEAKRYGDALKAYRSALSINPKSTEAKLAIALTYMEMGERDNAKKSLEELLESQPGNPVALLTLGRIEYEAGNLTKALALVKKAKSSSPSLVDAYYLAGEIYEKQGKKSQAKNEYEYILRFDPESQEAKSAISRLNE